MSNKHEIIGKFTLTFDEKDLGEEFWEAHDKADKDQVGFFTEALEMEIGMWVSHLFGGNVPTIQFLQHSCIKEVKEEIK